MERVDLGNEGVPLINGLIRRAFGNGFFGDYHTYDLGADKIKVRNERLGDISKRTFLPIPFIWEIWKYAGFFTSEDGSSLKVKPTYVPQATKYAELYKRETGKEVSIQTE